MRLEFCGSSKPTLGVEIELQVLDPETLDLTPKSEFLIDACQAVGLTRVKAEVHQSMLEIDSEISEDVKQCRRFLSSRIKQLSQMADQSGLKLGILGTHPFQKWVDRLITLHDRYQYLFQKFQWLLRRMNIYGLHVHVGVPNGEQAIAITNGVARYLPHLLALSANSPFWQGVDTGMCSSRINIMESFPLAGAPHVFKDWKDFEHYCETLGSVGAIASLKDLYWHIRPNLQFGTIEFRICDAMSTLDETMAMAALIQCLVVYVGERVRCDKMKWCWSQEQQWIAPENQWIAARYGLDGEIITNTKGKREKISDSLLELISTLATTAKNLNCQEELQHVSQIVAQGNGAQRQRKIFKETESLREVVYDSTREFLELHL